MIGHVVNLVNYPLIFIYKGGSCAFGGHRWRKSHSFAKIRLGMPTYMAQVPHTSRHPSTDLTKICHIDGASLFILRQKYALKIGPVSN